MDPPICNLLIGLFFLGGKDEDKNKKMQKMTNMSQPPWQPQQEDSNKGSQG
jgi:hypothetical protein